MWQLFLIVGGIILGWFLSTLGLNPAVIIGMELFILVILGLIIFVGLGDADEADVRAEEGLLLRLLFLATPLKWLVTVSLYYGAAKLFGFEGDWVLWTAAVTSVVQIDPSITALGTLFKVEKRTKVVLDVWATCDDPLMIGASTLFVDRFIVEGFSAGQLASSVEVLCIIGVVMFGTYCARKGWQLRWWRRISYVSLGFYLQPVMAAVLGLRWNPSTRWKKALPYISWGLCTIVCVLAGAMGGNLEMMWMEGAWLSAAVIFSHAVISWAFLYRAGLPAADLVHVMLSHTNGLTTMGLGLRYAALGLGGVLGLTMPSMLFTFAFYLTANWLVEVVAKRRTAHR